MRHPLLIRYVLSRYRYLGTSPRPQLQTDPSGFEADDPSITRLRLDPANSSLYAKLCGGRGGASAAGVADDDCKLQSEVITIIVYGACPLCSIV